MTGAHAAAELWVAQQAVCFAHSAVGAVSGTPSQLSVRPRLCSLLVRVGIASRGAEGIRSGLRKICHTQAGHMNFEDDDTVPVQYAGEHRKYLLATGVAAARAGYQSAPRHLLQGCSVGCYLHCKQSSKQAPPEQAAISNSYDGVHAEHQACAQCLPE